VDAIAIKAAASIEFAGALIIACYILVASVELLRSPNQLHRVQPTIAEGVLFALSFDVAATLLKTLALHTWMQFGTFAIVFAIRTIVKRSFRHLGSR